ncbi:hypothetical protein JTE90_017646 [Oedothorax gibbosus]|uniref:CRAL-TRIO domain-containing protein n=1 Tax=Oedothorax gibbosus TaxID=931172 RepID=A0AAV6U9R6_9ARAC|nr:hypothetical protein JTE90_017646 [Oedothorax gibbosus]
MNLMPIWCKGLSPELRKKAEVTLGERSNVQAKALVDFRRLINAQQDIYSRLDDVFLLRFLRTKKYNLQKAFKLYLNYYSFKQKGTFTGMRPSDMKRVIQMNNILYSPYRTPCGSHVAIYRLGAFDVSTATYEEMISTILLVGEMILDCEATQVCGGIVIVDLADMSLQHYRQFLTVNFISFIINLLQDCIPERIKDIHFVNEPYLFHVSYNVVKPIVKKKLKDRLHFHGSNMNSLHCYVPKECLPKELGGKLGKFNNKEFAEYFYSQEAFIERINKYGIIEKKPALNIEKKPASNIEKKPASNIEKKPASNIEKKTASNIEKKTASNIEKKPASNIEKKTASNIEKKTTSKINNNRQ